VSAVRESAMAVTQGVADFGLESELIGVHGRDLPEVITRLASNPPDLVFNLCESLAGDCRNEAVIPSILDMLKVPYTGTDAIGLGLCLHKDRAKHILHGQGISAPPHIIVSDPAELDDPPDLDYPYFLKLAHEDASIGIEPSNKVTDIGELRTRATELIGKYKQPVICERYIAGREVNVTVMGNSDDTRVLPLHEIDFSAMPDDRPHIVSYAAKWDENHVDYEGTKPVPMKNLTAELERAITATSVDAFGALGLRDFGRVDLRIDADGVPWVIDVNPNCDISPDAGVARAARHADIDYPNLVGMICEIAWRRYADDSHSGTD
jgi:D-alanine-D-alanine ligase